VIWWEGGLRVEVRGMLSLKELLKIAKPMVNIASISPNEFSKIPEPTIDILPTDDTHVAEGYSDNNFGDLTALFLQSYIEGYKNERIFLKFDLSTIPAGSRIIQAKLHLYSWRGKYSSINAQAYSVNDDAWSEVTITWNSQPSIGKFLDVVLLDNVTAENNWHSWDVTGFVVSEFAGDKIASLCLKAEVEGVSGQYAFESKEWWETLRPYLEITRAQA